MKNSESITIALPINKRPAETLKSFIDMLRLEGKQGYLKSPDFRNATFRRLRCQDIAKMFFNEASNIDMGITGLDTVVEQRLKENIYLDQLPPDQMLINDELARINSVSQILEIADDQPVCLFLLVRKEDIDKLMTKNGNKEKMPLGNVSRYAEKLVSSIVTSFPAIARASLIEPLTAYVKPLENDEPMSFIRLPLIVRTVRGQVEGVLRNGDFTDAEFAFDIVKSGESADRMGLVSCGTPILESRLGLYNGWIAQQKSKSLISDVTAFLREQLQMAGINCVNGMEQDFIKQLQPWRLAARA